MKKSAFYLDLLFTFGAVFLITLCLFRYMGISFPVSVALGIVCGGLSSFALGTLWASKRHTHFLKKADEVTKQKLFLHLALLPEKQATELCCQAYANHQTVQRVGKYALQTQDEYILLHLSFAPADADVVATLSRVHTKKTKTLLCATADDHAKRLCQRLGIRLLQGDELYDLFKIANALPSTYLGEDSPPNKKLLRKKICFSKRNAKRFFTGGALILLTSLWSPFPYYYLVFGSTLVIASLFIRLFGYA